MQQRQQQQRRTERGTIAGPATTRASCGRATCGGSSQLSVRGAVRQAPRAQPRINPVLNGNSSGRTRSTEQNPVATFLRKIGLSQYIEPVLREGFDDMETLLEIQEEQMKLMRMLPGHMLKLQRRLRELQPVKSDKVALLPSPVRSREHAQSRPSSAVPCGQTIDTVQKSWLVVKELGVANVGEILYKHLFKIAPQTKKLFPLSVRQRYYDWRSGAFEDESDFESSPALRNLFAKVVGAVGSAVAGLQNINKLVPELNALGMRHINYNMQEEYFEFGGQALVLTLRDGLGHMLTADVEQAWVSVYDFLAATIVCGLRTAKAQEARCKLQMLQPPAPRSFQLATRGLQPTSPQMPQPAQTQPSMPEVQRARSQEASHRGQRPPAAPLQAGGAVVPSGQTIDTVQKSWLVVKELGVATVGEILYKHLFEIAPQTKGLFPLSVRRRYQDWASGVVENEQNLENSPALRNLFAKVVGAVGSAVAGLQNVNELVPELNALGMRHIDYNMQEEYFGFGGQALVLTLRDGLGRSLTAEVEQAWVSVYDFISASIISGLRFAREKKALLQLQDRQESGSWCDSPCSANVPYSRNVTPAEEDSTRLPSAPYSRNVSPAEEDSSSLPYSRKVTPTEEDPGTDEAVQRSSDSSTEEGREELSLPTLASFRGFAGRLWYQH